MSSEPGQAPEQAQQQQQQQPKNQGKQEKKDKGGKSKSASVAKAPPAAFLEERVKLWDEFKASYQEELRKKAEEGKQIHITLPDGKVIEGVAWKTTPMEIAKNISRGLADAVVVAKVDGQYHDLLRPIEKSGTLQLFKFDSEEGKHCFWHSSAHILGQTLERLYGANLTIGPPVEEGFYYDVDLPSPNPEEKAVISPESLEEVNDLAGQIIKEKQNFERIAVPRDLALKMFDYNKFKKEIISKIPQEDTVTLYRCGNLIDLCRGPHLPNTGYVKAFTTTKIAGAYWLGKSDNEVLQRVYGIAFPDKKQLTEWQVFQAEAAKRDHRNVGKEQELFFFHPYSPGSAFMLPHGARIHNRLTNFIKLEYHKRGFTEVMSPNMFNYKLWETSGHWANYKENMFIFGCDGVDFSLKPMNCPGHCLMFDHRRRSYRELPIRFADFGVLHRNELAGALTGLTRVRRFQQDDAHIFTTPEKIGEEIESCLEFMQHVYGIFGFDFQLNLSTRPEKYLGELSVWDQAEKALSESLNKFGKPWALNPGDGAFYGPKIDIKIMDALKRFHQCATIQLDFQLPIKFNLEYQAENGEGKRPVIIHRAILGSVERMMAILIEHTGGKWPFWLSPRQAIVVSVSDKHNQYAEKVQKELHDAGYYVDSDLSDKTIPKKIRESQLAQYNYILVVGDEEVGKNTVNVRTRDNAVHGQKSVEEVLKEFADQVKEYK